MNQRSPHRTDLIDLERMMKSVPHFAPRRSGTMAACRARAAPEEIACQFCADYRAGACRLAVCPHLAERLALGVATYRELAAEAFRHKNHRGLIRRVERLAERAGGFRFCSDSHRRRLENWLTRAGIRAGPRWLAALYLLTARDALWQRTRHAVTPDQIHWQEVRLGPLDTQGYALYKAAKGLYEGELGIRPEELADRELVRADTLLLIVNAVLLVRYGRQVLEVGW